MNFQRIVDMAQITAGESTEDATSRVARYLNQTLVQAALAQVLVKATQSVFETGNPFSSEGLSVTRAQSSEVVEIQWPSMQAPGEELIHTLSKLTHPGDLINRTVNTVMELCTSTTSLNDKLQAGVALSRLLEPIIAKARWLQALVDEVQIEAAVQSKNNTTELAETWTVFLSATNLSLVQNASLVV